MAASDASGADSIPEKIRKAFINIPVSIFMTLYNMSPIYSFL